MITRALGVPPILGTQTSINGEDGGYLCSQAGPPTTRPAAMRVTLVHEASRRRLELEVIASKKRRKAIKNDVTDCYSISYSRILMDVTFLSFWG